MKTPFGEGQISDEERLIDKHEYEKLALKKGDSPNEIQNFINEIEKNHPDNRELQSALYKLDLSIITKVQSD